MNDIKGETILFLGGDASGKSAISLRTAERESARLAKANPSGSSSDAGAADAKKIFIATAAATDGEMRRKIERHRREREALGGWTTVESDENLAGRIADGARSGRVLLVDCVTLWLSRYFVDDDLARAESRIDRGRRALIAAIDGGPKDCTIILVGNEVGLGGISADRGQNLFTAKLGAINRELAAIADRVTLVVAGIELPIKRTR